MKIVTRFNNAITSANHAINASRLFTAARAIKMPRFNYLFIFIIYQKVQKEHECQCTFLVQMKYVKIFQILIPSRI